MTLPHGGAVEAAAKAWGCAPEDILDLSTGLHPAGPPAWLKDWLQEHAHLAAYYPDRQGEPARATLAAYMGVKTEQVLMLAGAQAGIEVLPQALGWQTLAIKQPCYAEPLRTARRAGCKTIAVDIQAGQYPDADAVWITSPHNPFAHQECFPKHRHGVLDESYMPFAERKQLGVLPRVVRLGSLTKTFCIPGLRLGYIIAEAQLVQQIQAWLPPWGTSTLAAHLLPRLLPEAETRDAQVVALNQRMRDLLEQHDWQVLPGRASFILGKPRGYLPDFDSSRILVRHFPEWKSLTGWVRLGYPLHARDWKRLAHALSTVAQRG